MTHFDRVDTGKGYTKMHYFGVRKGTLFSDFSGEFRVLVSTITGSGRVLAPGTDAVLEMVRKLLVTRRTLLCRGFRC